MTPTMKNREEKLAWIKQVEQAYKRDGNVQRLIAELKKALETIEYLESNIAFCVCGNPKADCRCSEEEEGE